MRVMMAFVAALLVSGPVAAQERPVLLGGELDQYLRVLELTGALRQTPVIYRSPSGLGDAYASDSTHLWATRYPLRALPAPSRRLRASMLDPFVHGILNSGYPSTRNDGALWAGRGLSGFATGGGVASWGPVTATLNPAFWYAQNLSFPLAPLTYTGRTPFAYPWYSNIDYPQRFGTAPVLSADWGQSSLRVRAGPVTAAVSAENLWWGPGYRNAIIMSNSAAGFPHVDVGTGTPVRIAIGQFEIRAIWGGLRESQYFDSLPANDTRYLAGLTAGYQPNFLPGLSVGFTRVLYQRWPTGGVGLRHLLGIFGRVFDPGPPVGPNDATDQLASIVGRWVRPAANIEGYFEWAHEDFRGNLRDLLVQPEHAAALTIGFQKLLPARNAHWRLAGEVTSVERSMTFLVRDAGPYYAHFPVIQGYTHRGQLLGAGIGPGANSQLVKLDRYSPGGRWGISLERVRYATDALYDRYLAAPFPLAYEYHPVELTAGFSAVRFLKRLDLVGGFELSHTLNRNMILRYDVTNLRVTFGLGWRVPASR